MKKIITLVLSILTVAVMANPVSKKVAEQIAVNQYALIASTDITDYTVSSMFETTYEGVVTFYTFNFKSGGFVVVAADDASIPVLAYSEEGDLTQHSVNPAAKTWMDDYSRAIVEISKTKLSNASTRPMWDKLLNKQTERSILDVAPLVAQNWDQGCYYNALCPTVSGGQCGRAWAGCVAVTMSVLMKYHQWPATGVGYHSYTPSGLPAQSANFAATTYNYSAMPNNVTSANAAVATLMYHAGVSVNMQYAAAGSGAYSEDVPFALINYFNYAPSTRLEAKESYPVMNDWYALIRTELDASRPVYYAGSSTASGGHAWICDGYRLSDNKFHMNWGWSGQSNGYFAIGSLNPGGNNFNDNNRVIVGVTPGNNQTAWIIQNSGFTAPSRGINYLHAVNQNVAWASAYDGSGGTATVNEFTRTTNGGQTWTPGQIVGGTTYGIGNICGLNENIAYVALYNGVGNQNNTCGIYKTSNGGQTWVQLPGALQGSASFANNVYFWNEQVGMCHGDVKDNYFEIYTTTNGGQTWTRVPQANITGGTPASGEGGWTSVIETAGENTVMFGTNKGKVYISDDRGVHWRITNANITPANNGGINQIAFTDPLNGIVAQTVAPVTYRRTSNGGQTWEAFTPTGPIFTNDLTSVPGSNGIYVSTGAATGATGVSYSTDFGSTWTLFPGTQNDQFLATDFFNNSTGYAGGFNADQNNNGMFRMLGTLGAATGPQIATNPSAITATLAANETQSIPLSITNGGNETLTWTITLAGNPAWLSVAPTSGNTAAGATSQVTVNLNSASLTPGVYTSTIVIANNSSTPTKEVPVTLTVGSSLAPPTNLTAVATGNNVNLSWTAPSGPAPEGFFDDFESYPDFSLTFSPWTTIDVDGAPTYTIEGVSWPNGGSPQAWIIFNSTTTTPALSSNLAYSGSKVAACFAGVPPPTNNDWLISPKTAIAAGDVVKFMAKSHTDQYGLERFKVAVSTTTTAPSAFTVISPGSHVTAPAAAYGAFSYDLSAYAGQEVYVAINCVSQDAFILLVDDFYIGAPSKAPVTVPNAVMASNVSKVITSTVAGTPNTVRGGERELLGYNVYRNGNKINAAVVTGTTYTDNGLAAGTYEYQVTAVYSEGESGFSNTASVTIAGGNSIILDFESYADFTLDISPWTTLDVDGSPTYGFTGLTFPNAGSPMSYIVFNPSLTSPSPVTGMTAHGGSRFGAVFASVTPPNNDYLISPKVPLGANSKISFWVKSFTDQYGLEEYKIAVSTTNLNPSSFTAITGVIQAPANEWTLVEYSLAQFAGQEAYVAIQCVSNDRFVFMVDDIQITIATATNDIEIGKNISVYPNPASGVLNLRSDVEILNMSLVSTSGKVVYESAVNNTQFAANVSEVPAGLYIVRLTTKQGVVTKKVNIK